VKYFDTTFIIKLYLREHGSKEVISLANRSGGLVCSDLGYTEFHAALHRNLRDGTVNRRQFEQVLDRFAEDCEIGQWHWIPITRDVHEATATTFRTIPGTLFLRCADAIHLSTAKLHGFAEICTNDRHLSNAASHYGMIVNNPISARET
jgi:predicted nucleic acid-binding protein